MILSIGNIVQKVNHTESELVVDEFHRAFKVIKCDYNIDGTLNVVLKIVG